MYIRWIESPALASELHDLTDRMLKPQNRWQLYLNDGGSLRWRSGDKVRTRQARPKQLATRIGLFSPVTGRRTVVKGRASEVRKRKVESCEWL